ncbi:MAG: hypothetical protein D6689_20340 [Deltaproteobacteria bacterium]|nr:MAG: hypothetical protein D6689_20340 [Deltaproteobacteria bacterium]
MRRSVIAVAPAALLVAISGWEIATIARAGRDTGTDAEWRAAAGAVRQRYRRGDLIVFAPRWTDPIGRMVLGDLIPVETAARMDAARYGRIWELSVRGARAPEGRGARVAWHAAFGAVTVRLLEREPVEVVTDFVDAFSRAAVAGAYATRSRDRDVAPAVDIEEVGFEPHRCVRVVPRPDQTVRVTYSPVALGRSLVGYVGLADVFTRRDRREPARLQVEVDGRPVADVTVGVDDGWVRFEADTEPSPRATVTFAATALGGRATDRLVCFAAEARR